MKAKMIAKQRGRRMRNYKSMLAVDMSRRVEMVDA